MGYRMFDIDFRRMIITIALAGVVIGGAVVALVLLTWLCCSVRSARLIAV